VRLVPLPDTELSYGTEIIRVRIADWRRKYKLPNEEETQPKEKTKTTFKKK
jgi:arginine repressor